MLGEGVVVPSTAWSGVGMACGGGHVGVGVVLDWWLAGEAASDRVGGLAVEGVTVLWFIGTLWVSSGGVGLEVAEEFFGCAVLLPFTLIPS